MAQANNKRSLIGILLVIIGTLFLLDNLGLAIDIPYYLFSWPAVFVVIGVINFLSGNRKAGLIFLTLATFFYLQYFDILRLSDVWPIVIIVAGISFILRKKSFPVSSQEVNEDIFNEIAIFGGTEKKFVSENFRGGKVTCIFGGSEIDLTESNAQEGAFIEVFCMFGGVDLRVPENWKINMDNVAIFGGFGDERNIGQTAHDVTVHIKGFVLFGGGEVKN